MQDPLHHQHQRKLGKWHHEQYRHDTSYHRCCCCCLVAIITVIDNFYLSLNSPWLDIALIILPSLSFLKIFYICSHATYTSEYMWASFLPRSTFEILLLPHPASSHGIIIGTQPILLRSLTTYQTIDRYREKRDPYEDPIIIIIVYAALSWSSLGGPPSPKKFETDGPGLRQKFLSHFQDTRTYIPGQVKKNDDYSEDAPHCSAAFSLRFIESTAVKTHGFIDITMGPVFDARTRKIFRKKRPMMSKTRGKNL